MDKNDNIHVIGAREKNLKNINIRIPKKKITVFTGVSGSGKSSLVFDTIAAESQRQLNETYTSFIRNRLPHYGQPDVDAIENLSVAVIINQKRIGGNARSTVGTITDIYSLLRLLFSRAGKPFAGYSDIFSFNNPKGMCPECEGLGKVDSLDIERLLDKNKSLNEGAILFPTFGVGGYRWSRYVYSNLFDNEKKIKDFTDEELDMLLYKNNIKLKNPHQNFPKTSLYEAVIPRIERSFLKKDSSERKRNKSAIENIVHKDICPLCKGARLNQKVLSCEIRGKNIAQCSAMQISDLMNFIEQIEMPTVSTVTDAICRRLEHLASIGLAYLSLDRETATLSGGESQRIKMVRQLGSSLSDITYIFDEPSIGLHPHDINKINNLVELLKDKGNTILIVEHDPSVIEIADNIIDIGPAAGKNGGEIVFEGSFEKLKKANTLTGRCINAKSIPKNILRQPSEWMKLQNVSLNNIKDISTKIPKGVMTVVTGVAGSGKSTLINQLLPKYYPEAVYIDQKSVHASKRSNIMTFTGIFDKIRSLFAKENNAKESLFSFNSEGACPECKGLGITYTELAFMDTVTEVCETCHGKRFTAKVLEFKLNGQNINDIINMTVEDALNFFKEAKIVKVLQSLHSIGLHYITMGQPLSSLSGGELQRVKLAMELDKKSNIYVLDEPTTGLHMSDIKGLMENLNHIVNAGNTLIIIEHNLDVITQADWVIDLGPGAGTEGGQIVFEGVPKDLINCEKSLTGKYLKKILDKNW